MAVIKAELDGEMRVAEISADNLTMSQLRDTLGELFGVEQIAEFDVQYVDENDDWIIIDSDEAFLAGLCESGSPFRVTLVRRGVNMDQFVACGHSLTEDELVDLPVANAIAEDEEEEDDDEDEDLCENIEETKGAESAHRDEELYERATQRLRESCPVLSELSTAQLRKFMEIMRLPLKKLVKAEILSRAEVTGKPDKPKSWGWFKRHGRARKHEREVSAAQLQALRERGLDVSEDMARHLVQVLNVYPRRFRKLGLIGQDKGDAEARALFELAAPRLGFAVNATELEVFMGLLQLPTKRLVKVGLLSEKEQSGSGNEELKVSMQPKSHHAILRFERQIVEALHTNGLPLHPHVIVHLVDRLAVNPKRFIKLGLVGNGQERSAYPNPWGHGPHGMHDPQGPWGFRHAPHAMPGPHPMHAPHGAEAAAQNAWGFGHGPLEPQGSWGFGHGPHSMHGPRGPHGMHAMHGPHGRWGRGHGPHGMHGPRGPCSRGHSPYAMHGPRGHWNRGHGPQGRGGRGGCARRGMFDWGFGGDNSQSWFSPMFGMWSAPQSQSAASPSEDMGAQLPRNVLMAVIVDNEERNVSREVAPGAVFEQRWKLQNSHSFPWPQVVQLVPANEDAITLGVTEPLTLTLRANPGEVSDVTVSMTAPTASGLYNPVVRLRDANTGLIFGQRLITNVLVVPLGESGHGFAQHADDGDY